ncbi:MAG: BrnT family toxin [Gammaproteobacteria bacterium]|nr:BrnT family toxin [Gammaproteobacteria bacterium]
MFREAVESFFVPHGFQLVDAKHSREEQRFYWVGKSEAGRILTTRFTRRGKKIRIIGSAEWRKFRRLYHETTKPE